MKRLKRDPEKFDPIELYAAIGREQGYKLNAIDDHIDFVKRVGDSIKAASDNPALIHGKRIESMFAHVAGGLGYCRFIKQEDTGNVFSDNEELQAPDYRVVLKSGEQFFVEIKNCHFKNPQHHFYIKKNYDQKLQNYAESNGLPLKYAIYYSQWNKWTLLSRDALTEQKTKYVTDFLNSFARSEMLALGDRMISTEPDLILELIADQNKDASISPAGEVRFTIGGVKMYCNGREIRDAREQSIAFYLMRFGRWPERDTEAMYEAEKIVGVRYIFSPEEPNHEHSFSAVGTLSSMISTAYSERTVHEQSVIALDIKAHPDMFAPDIPLAFKGTALPLWQFLIEPNYEAVVRGSSLNLLVPST